ncbi:MAG: hypothetical protein OHK0053_13330 [Microscillaceae bacterium]
MGAWSQAKPSTLTILVQAEHTAVALGNDFVAQIQIIPAEMVEEAFLEYRGQKIAFQQGSATLRWPVQTMGDQSWEALVQYRRPKAKEWTPVALQGRIQPVEAVLVLGGQGVFPLYQECQNLVQVAVPALGAAFAPEYESNVPFEKGAKLGEVVLRPKAETQAVLKVKQGETLLGQVSFSCLPVPAPTLVLLKTDGQPADLEQRLNPDELSKAALWADPAFKNALPEEAWYAIRKMEVNLFRGGRLIRNLSFAAEALDLSQLTLQSGDGVQLKVIEAVRLNAQGEEIPVSLANPSLSFLLL